jgi:hypothetical protein
LMLRTVATKLATKTLVIGFVQKGELQSANSGRLLIAQRFIAGDGGGCASNKLPTTENCLGCPSGHRDNVS